MNNMNEYNINDTIVALATPLAKSAIAVIRLSGKDAFNIASSICYSVITDKQIKKFEHRKSYFVNVKDKERNIIDELVILINKSPNSFTTEDTVEFYCHGSLVVIENLMNLIVSRGARLANRGEFTYRAYMGGRIGISEAEAIADLIDSENTYQAKASIYKMKGRFGHEIEALREAVLDTLTLVYGEIDFPEDETENFSYEALNNKLMIIRENIKNILSSSKTVKKLMDGIKVAILGKVNAGKSSIFNMLLDKNRAIVSNIAGTTRDSIHELIYINSVPFYIMDTAGLNSNSSDSIEHIGIEKSFECGVYANVILAVFDCSSEYSKEDEELKKFLETQKDKTIIYILNKIDLEKKLNTSSITDYIEISTKNLKGKDKLIEKLSNIFTQADREVFNNESYVNLREKTFLENSIEIIDSILEKTSSNYSLDQIAEDINLLNNTLGFVSGKIESDDVINTIFSKFCIGK